MFDKRIIQLIDALSSLIFYWEGVVPFLLRAGINPGKVKLTGNADVFWFNIVDYAFNNNKLDQLVDALLISYPENPHLLKFKEGDDDDYSLGVDIKKDVKWENNDPEVLEKITGKTNTLLPICFLSIGLEKAMSVARVVVEKKGKKKELGTGFLIKDNYFITNNHVIDCIETATVTTLQFNYEESRNNRAVKPSSFLLDPANGFKTSKSEDWTVVKVRDDPNKKFKHIDLVAASTYVGDFVNIIQHPGGRYKQIGLYHNMVTYCSDKVVQYLTDTEAGSSGSPVFNSDWELVALHHSGGMLREPGSSMKLMRNEGINIQLVVNGVKDYLNNLI
jgi:S1-C subfamily serine protease